MVHLILSITGEMKMKAPPKSPHPSAVPHQGQGPGTGAGQERRRRSNPAPKGSVEAFPDFVGFGLGHHTAQHFTPWLLALFKWSLAKAWDLITEVQVLRRRNKSFLTLSEIQARPHLKPLAVAGLPKPKPAAGSWFDPTPSPRQVQADPETPPALG